MPTGDFPANLKRSPALAEVIWFGVLSLPVVILISQLEEQLKSLRIRLGVLLD
jgi:hypothetical protein